MARGSTKYFQFKIGGSDGASIIGMGKVSGLKPTLSFVKTFDGSTVEQPNVSMEINGHDDVTVMMTLIIGGSGNVNKLIQYHEKHLSNDPDKEGTSVDCDVVFFSDEKLSSELGRYQLFGCKIGPVELEDADRDSENKPLRFSVVIGVARGGWRKGASAT